MLTKVKGSDGMLYVGMSKKKPTTGLTSAHGLINVDSDDEAGSKS